MLPAMRPEGDAGVAQGPRGTPLQRVRVDREAKAEDERWMSSRIPSGTAYRSAGSERTEWRECRCVRGVLEGIFMCRTGLSQ